uniref:SGNH hydrolase-type esterase domain-containing protein n=1 Tax=Sander lucioperca TaxID=283035 RepID=A0A8C9ZJ24_SANLU
SNRYMTDVEVVENNYCLGIWILVFASNQFVINTYFTVFFSATSLPCFPDSGLQVKISIYAITWLIYSLYRNVRLFIVIIGDSITRDLRFHNAVTHCFPGAKVADILAKVMDLIPSFPTSIKRIVVHCGHNDMSTRIQECERTRRDFTTLIEALKSTGKSVFISGPLPSLGRGSGLFSRLLSLNTWLQLTCSIHRIGFIDNFNLFWERGSLFSRDGIHPNTRGSQMLRGNLHHALHTQTSD